MGDLYVFDGKIIDGEEKLGFFYQTEANNWQGVFVEFNEEQAKQAKDWQAKLDALNKEQEEMIKSWLT